MSMEQLLNIELQRRITAQIENISLLRTNISLLTRENADLKSENARLKQMLGPEAYKVHGKPSREHVHEVAKESGSLGKAREKPVQSVVEELVSRRSLVTEQNKPSSTATSLYQLKPATRNKPISVWRVLIAIPLALLLGVFVWVNASLINPIAGWVLSLATLLVVPWLILKRGRYK